MAGRAGGREKGGLGGCCGAWVVCVGGRAGGGRREGKGRGR